MRERLRQVPAAPWWKRIKPAPAIATAAALLTLAVQRVDGATVI